MDDSFGERCGDTEVLFDLSDSYVVIEGLILLENGDSPFPVNFSHRLIKWPNKLHSTDLAEHLLIDLFNHIVFDTKAKNEPISEDLHIVCATTHIKLPLQLLSLIHSGIRSSH